MTAAVPDPHFRDQLAEQAWGVLVAAADRELVPLHGANSWNVVAHAIVENQLPLIAAEMDARVQAAAKIALDVLEGVDCQFFACPGPDAPFVHMATCSVCAGIQQIRAAALASPAPAPRAEEGL